MLNFGVNYAFIFKSNNFKELFGVTAFDSVF